MDKLEIALIRAGLTLPWILQVHETDGADQDFEVHGEEAARGCAEMEFASPTVRRVVLIDPHGNVVEDLVKVGV